MNGETANRESATRETSTDPDGDAGTALGDTLCRHLRSLSEDRERVVRGAGAVAVAFVALQTTLRVLHNLPFDPVGVPSPVRGFLGVSTPVVLGVAAVAVGVAAGRAPARVGLLFVGVFGPLALVSPAATLPAVAGVVGGGAFALVGSLGRPTSYRELRRVAIAVAFTAGVAVSVASAVGILPGGARGLGATFTLGALAAVGLLVETDRVGLVAGGLAFLGVVAAGTASPYVTGSALLVGFAVVGVPSLLVGLAVGGGVTAMVAGLRRREPSLAAGAGLCLLAGVPVTLPRATAVLLGATLVLVGPEGLTTRRTAEVSA